MRTLSQPSTTQAKVCVNCDCVYLWELTCTRALKLVSVSHTHNYTPTPCVIPDPKGTLLALNWDLSVRESSLVGKGIFKNSQITDHSCNIPWQHIVVEAALHITLTIFCNCVCVVTHKFRLLFTLSVSIHFFIFSGCLALPKLNLQFLTLHDYLLRNFNLFRLESTYEIRQDIEDVVWRMKPWWDVSNSVKLQ